MRPSRYINDFTIGAGRSCGDGVWNGENWEAWCQAMSLCVESRKVWVVIYRGRKLSLGITNVVDGSGIYST